MTTRDSQPALRQAPPSRLGRDRAALRPSAARCGLTVSSTNGRFAPHCGRSAGRPPFFKAVVVAAVADGWAGGQARRRLDLRRCVDGPDRQQHRPDRACVAHSGWSAPADQPNACRFICQKSLSARPAVVCIIATSSPLVPVTTQRRRQRLPQQFLDETAHSERRPRSGRTQLGYA